MLPRRVAVKLVGSLTVEVAGRQVTGAAIGSRKGRQFLALLAINGARPVALDLAVEALWQDAPPRDPGQNVAALVSRMRAMFGSGLVVRDGRGYRLGEDVGVDLLNAAELAARAEGADRHADGLAYARAGLALVAHGGVLEDEPYAVWAAPARAQHVDILLRVRLAAVDAALCLNDVPFARELARAAVAADPLDDVACRLLMSAYYAGGETAKALLAFEQLRLNLAAELGADPAPPTRELHLAVLRGVAPPLSHEARGRSSAPCHPPVRKCSISPHPRLRPNPGPAHPAAP